MILNAGFFNHVSKNESSSTLCIYAWSYIPSIISKRVKREVKTEREGKTGTGAREEIFA